MRAALNLIKTIGSDFLQFCGTWGHGCSGAGECVGDAAAPRIVLRQS